MLYIVQVGTTCTELIKSSNTCTFNSQLTGTRNLLGPDPHTLTANPDPGAMPIMRIRIRTLVKFIIIFLSGRLKVRVFFL